MVAGVRQLWMAKPSGSKNGRGIKVLADPLADAPRKEGILIQRYVHPPYLVGGLKVSRFLAWIGAACLRERVHGASITRRAVPGGAASSPRCGSTWSARTSTRCGSTSTTRPWCTSPACRSTHRPIPTLWRVSCAPLAAVLTEMYLCGVRSFGPKSY
jgi:hypothetical protein